MVRSLLTYNVADLFCGAGGFSTGLLEALGEDRVSLTALNHWDRAIETHKANHPNARSERADLYDEDPLKWFRPGELDLLIASPTCTFYSRARGGRPVSFDQRKGRMTPVQVVRWCKALKPRRLLVENVPEFEHWGPVSRITGKPRKEKRGIYFRQWLRDLEALGYKLSYKTVIAADMGGVTTRERLFVMGSLDGEPRWPNPTHSKDGVADLFGAGAKKHRAAREIINWRRKGKSIFNRKKPLATKTLLRIHAGLIKFGWPVAFVLKLRLYMLSLGIELPEITFFVFANRTNNVPKSLDGPLPTNTTTTGGGIGLVEPFALSQGAGGAPRPVSEPVPSTPTRGAVALVAPYYGAGDCRSTEDPLATVTTRDRFALVTPVTHDDASNRSRSVDEPLPTVTGAPRGELAFIVGAFGEREGQAPRVHSIDDPAPTLCAQGRIPLVQGITHEMLHAVDILFRMLDPDELAGAMGFPERYRFLGNKTEKTRMIGNAVEVKTARALITSLMEVDR